MVNSKRNVEMATVANSWEIVEGSSVRSSTESSSGFILLISRLYLMQLVLLCVFNHYTRVLFDRWSLTVCSTVMRINSLDRES